MPSRVSAVKNFPQPRDVKALQEFLGIMIFYHRFTPNLASILRPLFQVINTSKPRQALNWTNEMVWRMIGSPALAFRGTYYRIAVHSLPLRCGLTMANALESGYISISPSGQRIGRKVSPLAKNSSESQTHRQQLGEELPWVLLGLRIAPKEVLGYSSAELVYGEPLTVPGEFTPSQALPWSAT
ncbi:Pol polyprotein [Elysia marginata]|uniref:Pol polyprotein n=1 Tax=Elysia marginata TaxID=1093978 RepID=A0AAV4HGC3_9GAST|nr:Pol polyprotein [Elysia marginata]